MLIIYGVVEIASTQTEIVLNKIGKQEQVQLGFNTEANMGSLFFARTNEIKYLLTYFKTWQKHVILKNFIENLVKRILDNERQYCTNAQCTLRAFSEVVCQVIR